MLNYLLTDHQRERVGEKRKQKAGSLPKKKPVIATKSAKLVTHNSDIDSGDESDGQSALRQVEEKNKLKGARRGPGNASMKHFKPPVPVMQDKNMRWEFRCLHCPW